eukprot:1736224-Pyramimonas_sp.AAC.1
MGQVPPVCPGGTAVPATFTAPPVYCAGAVCRHHRASIVPLTTLRPAPWAAAPGRGFGHLDRRVYRPLSRKGATTAHSG